MLSLEIKGTLLLAQEGINGTIAANRQSMDTFLDWLKQDSRFSCLVHKESLTDAPPFYRTKVKLKKEIVTMGVEDINPNHIVGTYVKPEQWNDLISDPDVTLIDTRNEYEVKIGTFVGAINPQTTSFREFPNYVAQQLNPKKNKKVAMFCTGGIRCEKSTAYLKEQGFEEVYHLEGGILKYLEEIPVEDSLWQGECFVFDNRVTVNHHLEKGSYHQCNACRMPITEEEMQSTQYLQGVSCPHCFDETTEEQKLRFAQREKQMQLAAKRGEVHLGSEAADTLEKNKKKKKQIKNNDRLQQQALNKKDMGHTTDD
jgi:UPF0176 protein